VIFFAVQSESSSQKRLILLGVGIVALIAAVAIHFLRSDSGAEEVATVAEADVELVCSTDGHKFTLKPVEYAEQVKTFYASLSPDMARGAAPKVRCPKCGKDTAQPAPK